MRWLVLGVIVAVLGGCQESVVGVVDLDPPDEVSYQVEPSGTPGRPAGVVLRWSQPDDDDVVGWNVYGRGATSGAWLFRGATTSRSFHDRGQPELQYYVAAAGPGNTEGPASDVVTIDERLALVRPATLSSVSLNGAVALIWSDESYRSDPDGFWHYRVYSASYDLDRNLCGTDWVLEGTTIAPEFRVAAMVNGLPRCFGASGISIEGFESLWSPVRTDTPRPDARNVAVSARQQSDPGSGFRFWRDVNGDGIAQTAELGLLGAGSAADIDFSVERDLSGRLFLNPVRTGTTVAAYRSAPIGDLTDIDLAPVAGYSRTAIEARPGWGYVFQMTGGGSVRFGGLRVSHVGRDLVIFDWSFQTDPGNPELALGR